MKTDDTQEPKKLDRHMEQGGGEQGGGGEEEVWRIWRLRSGRLRLLARCQHC
jgi:hypothetical protein